MCVYLQYQANTRVDSSLPIFETYPTVRNLSAVCSLLFAQFVEYTENTFRIINHVSTNEKTAYQPVQYLCIVAFFFLVLQCIIKILFHKVMWVLFSVTPFSMVMLPFCNEINLFLFVSHNECCPFFVNLCFFLYVKY